MILAIFVVYVLLIVFGVINRIWWMVGVFGVMLVLNVLLLWCYWSKIQMGILLLELATTFLTEKPSAYFAALYTFIFTIVFFVFWCAALIG
jgi:hypothetical protein